MIGAAYHASLKIRDWPWYRAAEGYRTVTDPGDLWVTIIVFAIAEWNEGQKNIVLAVLIASKEASKLAYVDAGAHRLTTRGSRGGNRRPWYTDDILTSKHYDIESSTVEKELTTTEAQVVVDAIIGKITDQMPDVGDVTSREVISLYIEESNMLLVGRELNIPAKAVRYRVERFRLLLNREPELLEALHANS